MSSGGCTYRFIESSLATLSEETEYDVEIRQEPKRAKISIINERDRRPIEPPPILQLHWKNCTEEELKKSLQSPFYFVVANLVTEKDPETPMLPAQDYLSGSTVSSLYRLRDVDNSDGGFFVFGDLAVKKEGKFKLRFSLFEIVEDKVQNRRTILSETFTVFSPKRFPGPVESTFLSRTFSDQGVKMRIRKEHRLQSRKRKQENTSLQSTDTSVKRLHTKKSRMIVASPAYADTSSTQHDVFFGRWQATSKPDDYCTNTPPTCPHEEIDYKKTDPTQGFPSPESTVYTSPAMGVSRGYLNREMTTSSISSTCSTSWTSFTAKPLVDSPPQPMHTAPPSSSLANYHTCSDNNNNHKYHRLPTPPISITDIHQKATGNHAWGIRLPPLRAIMNHLPQPSLFPLLLPPPPTMIDHHQHYRYP
ncbi:velvet factor-domain-containing protein [Helicostylum pulchrum]|nr:velvet factor-domain-containing protein [Helicostylum pulchrum]